MKTSLYTLVLVSVFVLATYASAEECAICTRIQELDQKMLKVRPDAGDAASLAKQDEIVSKAEDILSDGLKDENFNGASALPLMKMLAQVAPYDQGMLLVQTDRPAFVRQYNKPDGVLKAALKKLSPADRDTVVDAWRPAPRAASKKESANDGAGLSPCLLDQCESPKRLRLPTSASAATHSPSSEE